MKNVILVLALGALSCAQAVAQGSQKETSELQPLSKADNLLRYLAPERTPVLQSGYRNPHDMWILYSPSFNYLSSSAQTFLLHKYGILQGASIRDKGLPPAALSQRTPLTPPATAGLQEEDGPGRNIKINLPSLDLLQRVQSETTNAVHGQNMVVAFNDTSFAGYGSSLAYSRDGGKSWQHLLPPLYPFGESGGDPILAVGPDGTFYYANLAFNGQGTSTIGFTRSLDGGATWSALVDATASVSSGFDFQDKDWMAVDNTTSSYRGTIYIVWTRFSDDTSINLVRSSDGGRTWSSSVRVAGAASEEHVVQGANIGIGPNGEVYVAYFDSSLPGVAMAKSVDGGNSFSSPVIVYRADELQLFEVLSGGFDNPLFPSVAVDTSNGPHRGSVYVALNLRPSAADDSDVVLVRSVDGGMNWSPPTRMSDDATTTDQFHPAVGVAGDGTLVAMWYDRRNDPVNNVLLDVYATCSTDGGATFSPNTRLTSSSWPLIPTPFGLRRGYHGDYNQLSFGPLGVLFTWADDRSGKDPDVYSAILPLSFLRVPAPNFSLSVDLPGRAILAGTARSFRIRAEGSLGFQQSIQLEVPSAPPGLTFQFSRAAIGPGEEAILDVQTTSSMAPGSYSIEVVGRAGPLSRGVVMRLMIADPLELSASPTVYGDLKDVRFGFRAGIDAEGELHVIAGGGTDRSMSSFRSLVYSRYRGTQLVRSALVVAPGEEALEISEVQMELDEQGSIFLLWRGVNPSGIANLYFSRSSDGGSTFSAPTDLSQIRSRQQFVSQGTLAKGPNGLVEVLYHLTAGTLDQFYLVRSTDRGASFGQRAAIPVSNDFFLSSLSRAALAIGSDGMTHILFRALATAADGLYYVRSADGATFEAPRLAVHEPQTSFLYHPALRVAPNGDLHLALEFSDYSLNQREIYYAASKDGGKTFSPPVNVSRLSTQGGQSFDPSLVLDEDGNPAVAWTALVGGILFPGGRDTFFAYSRDGGTTFSKAINLANNLGQAATLPLTLPAPGGGVMVIWEDETLGNNQLMVVGFSKGFPAPTPVPDSPLELSAKIVTEGVKLSWIGSPRASGYSIKRRGPSESTFSVLAVGVHDTEYLDSSAAAGSAYVYVVSALLADQESPNSNEVSVSLPACTSCPASPQTVVYALATAARSPGLGGTFFTTDLWLSNPSDSEVTVEAEFLGSPRGSVASIPLGPHQSRFVADILFNLFSIGTNTFGPVRFKASGLRADRCVLVSRTSTPAGDGSGGGYGLSSEGRRSELSASSILYLAGIPQNSAFRTNVGLVNLTDQSVSYSIRLLDQKGGFVSSTGPSGVIGPLSSLQFPPGELLAGASPDYPGVTATVTTSAAQGVLAYATPIDNRTGDASFIYAAPQIEGKTSGTAYVPVITKVDGAFGTRWSSRMAVFNPGTMPVTLTLLWQQPETDNRQAVGKIRQIGPKETLLVSDAITELFGQTGGYGAVRIHWTSESGLAPVLTSVTSTPIAAREGTFGLQVNTSDLVEAARNVAVAGLRQDDQFRTNVGYVNATAVLQTVQCTLRDPSGSVAATRQLVLQPFDYQQLNVAQLFSGFEFPAGTSFTLEVKGSAPLFIYASLIDNRTQDPTFLPGIALSGE
ncbi:MAG: sialidase family protein [Acidobacteriota bacterium]